MLFVSIVTVNTEITQIHGLTDTRQQSQWVPGVGCQRSNRGRSVYFWSTTTGSSMSPGASVRMRVTGRRQKRLPEEEEEEEPSRVRTKWRERDRARAKREAATGLKSQSQESITDWLEIWSSLVFVQSLLCLPKRHKAISSCSVVKLNTGRAWCM